MLASPVVCSDETSARVCGKNWWEWVFNNGSKRELQLTATYRKVTSGFRSDWGKDLFAAFRSIVGTAARRGIDAYQAFRMTLSG